MALKTILCQGLGKSVSNLILGVNGEYFDKPLPHMFAKMIVAYGDVIGSRGQSLGSLASLRAPELSSKTLQYM
jgi:hypothetical protein